MEKYEVDQDKLNDVIANKKIIVAHVSLVYNRFHDRVDSEFECKVYTPKDVVLSQIESCFVESFCENFADAVRYENLELFDDLISVADELGFYVAYQTAVDETMNKLRK